MARMDWDVIFYRDNEGNESVNDFISSQSAKAIAQILHVVDLLRQFNITLSMPYVRKIDKSGVRELRIKHGSDIYRIFFFAYTERQFVLLHAIQKKKDKIPESDKNLAIQRMNDYKSRY
jgi:phage-related protein